MDLGCWCLVADFWVSSVEPCGSAPRNYDIGRVYFFIILIDFVVIFNSFP